MDVLQLLTFTVVGLLTFPLDAMEAFAGLAAAGVVLDLITSDVAWAGQLAGALRARSPTTAQ